jgi:hypothetical protein
MESPHSQSLQRKLLSASIPLSLSLLFVSAHAQTNIRDLSVSSDPGINNSAIRLDGALPAINLGELSPGGGDTDIVEPWVINVYAGAEDCLRLDVTRPAPMTEPDDLELVVIAPDGNVYRNNDRSASNLRPLVKINTFIVGFYTVRVQLKNLGSRAQAFTLLYGRYNLGNPNCANATRSLVSREAAAMGLSGEEEEASALPSPEVPEDTEEP